MPVEKAKAHFLGKPGHKRLNCGQAVIHAFKEKFLLSDDAVERFRAFGGGRAPEGLCGAFYAAKVLLAGDHPEKFKDCEKAFLELAGSTKCREIRAFRKLSCLDCVAKMAEFIDRSDMGQKERL